MSEEEHSKSNTNVGDGDFFDDDNEIHVQEESIVVDGLKSPSNTVGGGDMNDEELLQRTCKETQQNDNDVPHKPWIIVAVVVVIALVMLKLIFFRSSETIRYAII